MIVQLTRVYGDIILIPPHNVAGAIICSC